MRGSKSLISGGVMLFDAQHTPLNLQASLDPLIEGVMRANMVRPYTHHSNCTRRGDPRGRPRMRKPPRRGGFYYVLLQNLINRVEFVPGEIEVGDCGGVFYYLRGA